VYVCIYVSYALLFVFGKHSIPCVVAVAVAARPRNMQPIKMFLFMYIFCRARRCKMQSPRCKLHVARAGGKVSCFDMNVSFAHLSSLINILLSLSLPLAPQRLKLRYPAFLSRFLLAWPYPIYPMCNVHPMCHQYLQQSISQN